MKERRMWIMQRKRQKEYGERERRGIVEKQASGLKMKHNERNSPEAWVVFSRTFPFQHHQRRKNLPILCFLSLHSCAFSLSPLHFVSLWHSALTLLLSTLFSPSHKNELCCLMPPTSSDALLWNCTDVGQRLISLSLLTKPGLRLCILLALRPLWFNIAPADMTSHSDISLLPMWQRDGGLLCRVHQSHMNN